MRHADWPVIKVRIIISTVYGHVANLATVNGKMSLRLLQSRKSSITVPATQAKTEDPRVAKTIPILRSLRHANRNMQYFRKLIFTFIIQNTLKNHADLPACT